MNKEEIQVCPFCKKAPEVLKTTCLSNGFVSYSMWHSCRVLYMDFRTGVFDSEEELVRAWNKCKNADIV